MHMSALFIPVFIPSHVRLSIVHVYRSGLYVSLFLFVMEGCATMLIPVRGGF